MGIVTMAFTDSLTEGIGKASIHGWFLDGHRNPSASMDTWTERHRQGGPSVDGPQ